MSDKNKSDLIRIFGEDRNSISGRKFDVFKSINDSLFI